MFFFFSSRRRHTRCSRDWSSDVCSSDLLETSARSIRNRGCFHKCSILLSTPVTRLSSATTSQPSAINRSHKCDPRKPAPPVTTARMHPPLICKLTVYPEPRQLTTASSRDSMPRLFDDYYAKL